MRVFPWTRIMRRDVLGALGVVVLSIGVGFLINALRAEPLPLVPEPPEVVLAKSVGAIQREKSEPLMIEVDRVQEALDSGEAVFVDARESFFYEVSRAPRAVSLPRVDFREAYPRFAEEVGKDQAVIVYCSEPDCVDSTLVAKALVLLGYERVEVFRGGWVEWEAAGLPVDPQ